MDTSASQTTNPPGQADGIYVATNGTAVFIRIVGPGSFKNSHSLKEFCLDMISKGRCQIILDMRRCSGLDSTFMGILAAIVRRLPSGGEMIMANVSRKNEEIIHTVGLDRLVKSDQRLTDPELKKKIQALTGETALVSNADNRTVAQTILSAHEELVAADPANLPKFQNVLDVMKIEVAKYSTPE